MKLLSNKYDYILNVHAKSGCICPTPIIPLSSQGRIEFRKEKKLQHWHNVQEIFKPKIGTDLPKVTINCIRNPYDRVVSMFTNKMLGKTRLFKSQN